MFTLFQPNMSIGAVTRHTPYLKENEALRASCQLRWNLLGSIRGQKGRTVHVLIWDDMNFHVFCVNKPLFEIWQGGQPYVFLRDFGQKTCLGRKCDLKKVLRWALSSSTIVKPMCTMKRKFHEWKAAKFHKLLRCRSCLCLQPCDAHGKSDGPSSSSNWAKSGKKSATVLKAETFIRPCTTPASDRTSLEASWRRLGDYLENWNGFSGFRGFSGLRFSCPWNFKA